MTVKEALKELANKLDVAGTDNHTVSEVTMNLPIYLGTLPLSEQQIVDLTKLCEEFTATNARERVSLGSSQISLAGIINWLDVRCSEYTRENRSCDAQILRNGQHRFSEEGGWKQFGVM